MMFTPRAGGAIRMSAPSIALHRGELGDSSGTGLAIPHPDSLSDAACASLIGKAPEAKDHALAHDDVRSLPG
jgi:hypothetical protein